MMKVIAKTIIGLALTGLLAACSGQKHVIVTASSTPVKPQANLKIYISPTPKLRGQQTVEDIVQGNSTYAVLNLYFANSKISSTPKEVIFIVLKQEKKLELWARDSGEFRFIRDYVIQAASGVAGPKLRQGDRQVPEGIYRITRLNYNSRYHLSMKINYPNDFDLFHAGQEKRTAPGSDIYIHGKAVSIGCLAMGDEAIEELFVLTSQVGIENVKVIITPHDPRTYPLTGDSKLLPKWTPELYSIISHEIKALSPVVKLVKTGL